MNYRETKILAEETLAAAGTKTIDLRMQEPISRIEIMSKVTKGSEGVAAHPAADITKIELVDGSDRLFSLTGYEAQALNIYDRKCPTRNHGFYMSGSSQRTWFGLDFGRYLWDEQLALDPTKFSNPQLKITYDQDVSDQSATAIAIEVIGHLFDEKVISPIGFLMSKEYYDAASAADGAYKYVDLPTDFPYRKMLLRAFYTDREPWFAIEALKLDEDNDKRILFDVNLENYFRERKGVWQPVQELLWQTIGGAAVKMYFTPTDYSTIVRDAAAIDDNMYRAGYIRGGVVTWNWNGTAKEINCTVHGWLPNHCFEFPFGKSDDIDDWYDVTRVGALRLRAEGGSGDVTGEFQVVLQQLRRY